MAPFPWFKDQAQYLSRALNNHQLAHALLLQGPKGLGKFEFARWSARTVLCQQQVEGGCGVCKSCLLIKAGTHPDCIEVQPEGRSAVIKIDQVRSVSTFLQQTATQGSYKIVLIEHAEAMNLAASNAILKTLEEPAGNTLIILTTDSAQKLLPTIRSRCQVALCQPPAKEQAIQWLTQLDCEGDVAVALELAQGTPFSAKALLENNGVELRVEILRQYYNYLQQGVALSVVSSEWAKLNLTDVFDLLITVMSDVLKLLKGLNPAQLTLSSQSSAIQAISKYFNQHSAMEQYQQLLNAKHNAQLSCNLNPQLVVQQALMRARAHGASVG